MAHPARTDGSAAMDTDGSAADADGFAAVELVLVLPLLLALIGAVLFTGWLGMARSVLDRGVHAGLRAAMVPTSPDLRSYATVEAVAARVDDATPLLTPSSVTVTPAAGQPNGQVTVAATYTVTNPVAVLLAPLRVVGVSLPATLTLSASATGRRE